MKINYSFIKLFILLLLAMSKGIYAQQDAQYTQYTLNTLTINPGYTGSRGALSVVGLHRTQWLGVDGAPSTQTLSVHTPVRLSRVGLGGSIINDKIGPVSETYFDLNFSYSIPTSKYAKLSFGLKAGGRLFNVDFNKLEKDGNDDEVFFNDINSQFNPSVGAGLYYHNQSFYLGLSVPNVLETEHLEANDFDDISSASSLGRERLGFFLIAGHVFYMNKKNDIEFKPTALVKLVAGAPLQVDFSANFLFHEKLTLGLAYRWSAALSAVAAFQVSDKLLIGLAYDRETTELAQVNSGSFEIVLRYEVFTKYYPQLTPKFF